jgi:hypothetical protein
MVCKDLDPRQCRRHTLPRARVPLPTADAVWVPVLCASTCDTVRQKQPRGVVLAGLRPEKGVARLNSISSLELQPRHENGRSPSVRPNLSCGAELPQLDEFGCRIAHEDCPHGGCETKCMPSLIFTVFVGSISSNSLSGFTRSSWYCAGTPKIAESCAPL